MTKNYFITYSFSPNNVDIEYKTIKVQTELSVSDIEEWIADYYRKFTTDFEIVHVENEENIATGTV